jgi:hypothetical protein
MCTHKESNLLHEDFASLHMAGANFTFVMTWIPKKLFPFAISFGHGKGALVLVNKNLNVSETQQSISHAGRK